MTTAPSRLVQMLRDVTAAFTLRKVAHAVAGGMAVAAHGLPRATKDIDVLIASSDEQQAEQALRELGFARVESGSGLGFVRFVRCPLPELPEVEEWVDLLLARQPVGLELIRAAAEDPIDWEGARLPVVSVEGVVVMKLLALANDPSRVHDRSDIIGLLQAHGSAVDRAWIAATAKGLGNEHAERFRDIAAAADQRPQAGPARFGL